MFFQCSSRAVTNAPLLFRLKILCILTPTILRTSTGEWKSGYKTASFDMTRRRISASINCNVVSMTYGASR